MQQPCSVLFDSSLQQIMHNKVTNARTGFLIAVHAPKKKDTRRSFKPKGAMNPCPKLMKSQSTLRTKPLDHSLNAGVPNHNHHTSSIDFFFKLKSLIVKIAYGTAMYFSQNYIAWAISSSRFCYN